MKDDRIATTRLPRIALRVAACAGLLVNCGSATGPDEWALQSALITGLEVAHLDGGPIDGPLLPGAPVAIVVTTAGSSSCTRPGPVSLDTTLHELRFEVHDWVRTGEVACTRDLRPYERTVLHTLFEPGVWTVRATGSADSVVRVTVGTGDAGDWALEPAPGVELQLRLLDGSPISGSIPVATTLSITVTSAGSSSCTRPGPVTASEQPSTLSLDVRDWALQGMVACTANLRPLPRTLLHTVMVAGEYTIRAVGAGDDVVVRLSVTPTEQ